MRDVLFLEGLSQIRDKILVRTQVSRVELRQNRESRYPEHGYRKGLAYNTIEVLPNPERILVQCNWQGRPRGSKEHEDCQNGQKLSGCSLRETVCQCK